MKDLINFIRILSLLKTLFCIINCIDDIYHFFKIILVKLYTIRVNYTVIKLILMFNQTKKESLVLKVLFLLLYNEFDARQGLQPQTLRAVFTDSIYRGLFFIDSIHSDVIVPKQYVQ